MTPISQTPTTVNPHAAQPTALMSELPEEFDSPSGSYAKGSPWHNSIPLEKSLNDIIDFWQKNDRD